MASLRVWQCWREILRFALLSQDDSVEVDPDPPYPFILCHHSLSSWAQPKDLNQPAGSFSDSPEYAFDKVKTTAAIHTFLGRHSQPQAKLSKPVKYAATNGYQTKPTLNKLRIEVKQSVCLNG